MNSCILNNTGLLKGYQQVYRYLQESYTQALTLLTKVFGDNVIIAGCNVAGGSISDGIVIVGGEVLPFVGGPVNTHIAVQQLTANEDYKFTGAKPVYLTRQAAPGSAGVLLADFFRMSTFRDHLVLADNSHQVTKVQAGLSELPNAKSDDHFSNNSNVLATSKAVWEAAKFSHISTGSFLVGNLGDYADNDFTITHNAGTTNYTIILTNSSPVNNAGETRIEYRVTEKNENDIKVQLIEYVADTTQQISLHYLLIKHI